MKQWDEWEEEPRFSIWKTIKMRLKGHQRLRICLILLIGLWIAAGTRFLTERIYLREESLREAFVSVNSGIATSTLEFAAEYGTAFLTERDKNDLVNHLAGELGITAQEPPELVVETNRTEVVLTKQARQAETTIKLISLAEASGVWTHYVTVQISILNDTQDSILYYRELLQETATELELTSVEVSLLLSGKVPGELSLSERNSLADRMLQKLDCTIVAENRQTDMYTVYAYTRGMKEYIESDGKRINVQLAMYYDEIKEVTVVYLASPVINASW